MNYLGIIVLAVVLVVIIAGVVLLKFHGISRESYYDDFNN